QALFQLARGAQRLALVAWKLPGRDVGTQGKQRFEDLLPARLTRALSGLAERQGLVARSLQSSDASAHHPLRGYPGFVLVRQLLAVQSLQPRPSSRRFLPILRQEPRFVSLHPAVRSSPARRGPAGRQAGSSEDCQRPGRAARAARRAWSPPSG